MSGRKSVALGQRKSCTMGEEIKSLIFFHFTQNIYILSFEYTYNPDTLPLSAKSLVPLVIYEGP